MLTNCIFEVKVKFETVWCALLWKRLLTELNWIKFIAYSEIFLTFRSDSSNNSFCIYSCANKKATSLKSTTNIMKKCSQFRFWFEKIVHWELATYNVKYNLLSNIFKGLMSFQDLIYCCVLIPCISHNKYARILDLPHPFQSFNSFIN